jgi:hypothetical protein
MLIILLIHNDFVKTFEIITLIIQQLIHRTYMSTMVVNLKD